MDSIPVPAAYSDEGTFLENDASTAPTTPEGSPAFSPVLRPRPDGHLDMGMASLVARSANLSLSSALLQSTTPRVRNICCVGAGYVG